MVTRAQLLKAGITPDRVDHRLRTGWLQRLHQGVYGVGPLVSPRAREMAAVLACGESAVLGGCCALDVWAMLPVDEAGEPVEVIVRKGRAGRKRGVRVRHLASLRSDEITTYLRIPITTPARTLLDVAAVLGDRRLERALAEGIARRLVKPGGLLRLLARHARRPGVVRLRALLESPSRPAFTRSEAEERLLALTRRTGLEPSDTNVRVAGYQVDFLWRREGLVVEVDGRAFHDSDRRFERDRRRDAALLAAGLRVMRVTWRQLVEEPERTMVQLCRALSAWPRS